MNGRHRGFCDFPSLFHRWACRRFYFFNFKQRQRAQATYVQVKSVQWTYACQHMRLTLIQNITRGPSLIYSIALLCGLECGRTFFEWKLAKLRVGDRPSTRGVEKNQRRIPHQSTRTLYNVCSRLIRVMKLQGARRGGRNGNRDASLHRHGPVDEIDRAASRTARARGLATDGRTDGEYYVCTVRSL